MDPQEREQPEVVAADDSCMSYSDARRAWEAGEFSDWANQHGFPLVIDGDECKNWEEVEDSLSDPTWDS